MKRKLLALIPFLFTSFSLLAQFTPIGTQWHYMLREPGSDSAYGQKIEAVRDTLFSGKNALVLEGLAKWLPRETGVDLLAHSYLLQDGEKTFIYDFNRDSFSLWVDNNWQVGDTFLFQWGQQVDSFIVSQKGAHSGISNVVQHQIQHLDKGQLTWRTNFYYPVGYTYTFLPRENTIPNELFANMDSLLHLQCFDNTSGISFDISAFGCETKYHIGTGLDKIDPSLITIYPNPSQGSFQIEVPENMEISSYSIMTLDGKLNTKKWEEGASLNLDLKPGIYLVNLHFSNGTFASKKVVVY